MKTTWGRRLTTVFVRQGHYAHDLRLCAMQPPADIAIDSIGELVDSYRRSPGSRSVSPLRKL
jgi:hypothetical protein